MQPSDLKAISTGTPHIPVRTAMLSDWFNRINNEKIQVPASVTTSLFVFSFEQMVDVKTNFRKMSSERIKATLNLLKSSLNSLDDAEVVSMARELQLVPSELDDAAPAQNILDSIRDNIRRSFLMQGVSSFFIEDVLSSSGSGIDLRQLGEVKYEDLHRAISKIQDIYSRLAAGQPAADIVSTLRALFEGETLFATIRQLHFLMTAAPGGSVSTKLSHVLNTFSRGMNGQDIVTLTEEVPGILYQVDGVDGFPNLEYKDLLGGYFAMIRTIMGVTTTNTTQSVNFRELLTGMMTGVDMPLPFVPSDLRPESLETVERFVVQQFTSRVIELICKRDYGTVASGLRSIMDDRKYRRNETFDAFLQESLDVVSVIFEAFKNVTGMLRGLIDNPTIWFDDVHPVRRKQYTKSLWEYLSQFSSFSTATDDRRRLYDLALVVNEGTYITTSVPKFIVPDSVIKNAESALMYANDKATEFAAYFKQPTSSSMWDAPVPVNHIILSQAKEVHLDYMVRQRTPEFLTKYDAMRSAFMLQPMKDVISKSRFSFTLMESARAVYVATAEEFATRLSLPLDVAQRVWKGADFYLDFSGTMDHIVVWPHSIAPVLETRLLSDTNYHLAPWVGTYPYLLKKEYVLTDLSSGEPIDPEDEVEPTGGKPKRGGGKGKPARTKSKTKRGVEDPIEGEEGFEEEDAAPEAGGNRKSPTYKTKVKVAKPGTRATKKKQGEEDPNTEDPE